LASRRRISNANQVGFLAVGSLAANRRRTITHRIHDALEIPVHEIFYFIGFLIAWIVLQAYILPRFGIST
jgi:hypothetical protein